MKKKEEVCESLPAEQAAEPNEVIESSEGPELSGISEDSENSENCPESGLTTEPQQAGALVAPTAAELEEAEMRGYLRGRNERIEELMEERPMFGAECGQAASSAASEVMILNNMRRSVWD